MGFFVQSFLAKQILDIDEYARFQSVINNTVCFLLLKIIHSAIIITKSIQNGGQFMK